MTTTDPLTPAPPPAPVVAPVAPTRVRLTPNLFGTSFGLAGLAATWTAAAAAVGLPTWPATALWAAAALVHVVVAVAYLRDAPRHRRLASDVADPTLGPFTALGFVPVMLLGAWLHGYQGTAGQVVVVVGVLGTVLLGAHLTGGWITSPGPLQRWHPGYFLPSVAGGLVAAQSLAKVGWHDAGLVAFGYGAVSWLVLGSILLVRLMTQPALPAPLLPTMAIEVAPAVVASNAWFTLNGGRSDTVVVLLAGYAVFMALVQVRLVPLYLRSAFGPGFWSFSFSYAALATTAVTWLHLTAPAGWRAWVVVVLAVLTLGYAALVARTVLALARGTYFARVPAV
ncbi:TDT family transporter [Kineococcus rhizosphaerae]|uniref:Tellurite resistance protein n=1 Tax=Kineococcus rhizosphaerae TaxID=559628 RepID=A0A2T0R2T0_9ACTN|nr:TDT family transporter [Kineococcus rhizosphaerae]PRY14094.1 tellurite resistance protein [Kineococcus rhizosphaerae]